MIRLLDRTKKKISSLIRLIEKINAVDFPYNDSNFVLDLIKEQFVDINGTLIGITEEDKMDRIQQLCQRSIELYDKYLPILGYIERSADLDGAVELHGPLLRMTHKAINKNAKLIISSEWHYSPFTALVDDLSKQDIVMVGMPCSDASNALIAPAAGHELGHNIWLKEGISEEIESKVKKIVCDEIRSNWSDVWEKIIPYPIEAINPNDGFLAAPYYALSEQWSILQCEEVFCDFIGLIVFRESYLHTFEYLSAPGDRDRTDFNYPSLYMRADLMSRACSQGGIPVPTDFVLSFVKPLSCKDDQYYHHGEIADVVCERLWVDLYNRALKFVKDHKLNLYDEDDVRRNIEAYRLVVPASKNKGIVNIINSAWQIANEEENFLRKNYPNIENDRTEVLNELVLKSFEVFEIEQRLGNYDLKQ